jgi:hypothetical protein
MINETAIDRNDEDGAALGLVDAVFRASADRYHGALYDLCAAASEPLVLRGPGRQIAAFVRVLTHSAAEGPGSGARPDAPTLGALDALGVLLSEAASDFAADPVGGRKLPTAVPEADLFEAFAEALDRDGGWDLRPVSIAFGHVLSHDERDAIDRFRIECARILDMIARARAEQGREPAAPVTRLGRVLSVYSTVAFCYLQRAAALRDAVTADAMLQDTRVQEHVRAWGLCRGLPVDSVTDKQWDLLRELRTAGLLQVTGAQYQLRAELCDLLEGRQVVPSCSERPPSSADHDAHLSAAPHGGKISLVEDDEEHRRLAERYLRGR